MNSCGQRMKRLYTRCVQQMTALRCRASHGTKFLSNDEVEQLYGSKRHWQHFETLIDSVNNIGGMSSRSSFVS